MKTRAFKSGEDQLVRIPAELAFADADAELEVTRAGRTLIIQPVEEAGSLKEAMDRLRALPKLSSPWTAERIEIPERDWKV